MSVKYTDILTRHDRAKAETRKTHIPSNLQPAEQSNSVKLNLNTRQTTKRKQSIIQIHLWSFLVRNASHYAHAYFPRDQKFIPCACENCLESRMLCPRQGLCATCVPLSPFCILPYFLTFLSPFFLALLSEKGHIMSNIVKHCQTQWRASPRKRRTSSNQFKPRLTRVGKSPKEPSGTI